MPHNPDPESLKTFAHRWKSSFEKHGRLPAAFLFEGSASLQIQETVDTITLSLLGKKENHPDLFKISPEKNSIKIDVIREMTQKLSLKPLQGERLVVIIEGADRMTEGASNALLKTLEEPPSYVLFILLSEAPQALSATIRSRCQRVFFQISSGEMKERLGNALEWFESLRPILSGSPLPFSRASEMADEIAHEKKNFSTLFEFLRSWWHDLAMCVEGLKEKILLVDFVSDIEKHASQKNMQNIFEDMDVIDETERAFEGNVNKTLALERLFVKLTSS